jgi:hypothetical protein
VNISDALDLFSCMAATYAITTGSYLLGRYVRFIKSDNERWWDTYNAAMSGYIANAQNISSNFLERTTDGVHINGVHAFCKALADAANGPLKDTK